MASWIGSNHTKGPQLPKKGLQWPKVQDRYIVFVLDLVNHPQVCQRRRKYQHNYCTLDHNQTISPPRVPDSQQLMLRPNLSISKNRWQLSLVLVMRGPQSKFLPTRIFLCFHHFTLHKSQRFFVITRRYRVWCGLLLIKQWPRLEMKLKFRFCPRFGSCTYGFCRKP